jgi:hypothetical protein
MTARSDPSTENRRRAYRYGWIAMKLAGEPDRNTEDFFKRHVGIAVKQDAVERAIRPLKAANPNKLKRGSRRASHPARQPQSTGESAAIWTDWLRVDEHRLGLRKVLVHIGADGFALAGLVDALQQMPGIRQVLELKESRDVYAVALLHDESEEDDLRARLLEFAPGRPVRVLVIRQESDAPAQGTWLDLAVRQARDLTQGR